MPLQPQTGIAIAGQSAVGSYVAHWPAAPHIPVGVLQNCRVPTHGCVRSQYEPPASSAPASLPPPSLALASMAKASSAPRSAAKASQPTNTSGRLDASFADASFAPPS
jgi:hypothetical protein